MTYSEAIRFLYGLQLFGARPGLERTWRLAELAGNPHRQLRFIHVAGTNGKGSTCAMLESIYRAAGRRVGLFTSPHLVSFRERLQVNRRLIAEADVARLAAEQVEFLKTFPADEHPTMFEVVAVMALRYFAEQRCDLVIWETGLGGRLDATNIVTPLASVITNIGLDHEQWLGDTLEKIAAEKAGIIKPGVPVFTAADQPEVRRVIAATARAQVAPLTQVESLAGAIYPTALAGDHQRLNAALALATVRGLQTVWPVSEAQLQTGLATVTWPGRLQFISRPDGQRVLLDGAHNPAGETTLLAALPGLAPGIKPTFILGMLADKSWREMAAKITRRAGRVLTVPVASARSVAAPDLAAACHSETAPPVTACASLAEALERAKADPFVVITGSLYLVGEALELLGAESGAGERGLNEWTPGRAG
jgi:dihydrofolate synthase/folylpolyglutamate synthase